MKIVELMVVFMFLNACCERKNHGIDKLESAKVDTVILYDTIFSEQDDWQIGFNLTHDPEVDSIWGKPVIFYIENPKCSPIAIDFYVGQFRPTDNDLTGALLSLVTTNDNHLRPFYRWCLDKTIQIQDGALAEYTGIPARQYAEKFPEEFFVYMDIDTTGTKYKNWINAISYSGLNDGEFNKKSQIIRERMSTVMKRNCLNCDTKIRNRIDKLTGDCFP
jgi:hypothetical protein